MNRSAEKSADRSYMITGYVMISSDRNTMNKNLLKIVIMATGVQDIASTETRDYTPESYNKLL